MEAKGGFRQLGKRERLCRDQVLAQWDFDLDTVSGDGFPRRLVLRRCPLPDQQGRDPPPGSLLLEEDVPSRITATKFTIRNF